MNYYALCALINSAIYIFVSLIFLIKKDRPRVGTYFNLFNFAIIIWSGSYYFWQTSQNYDEAFFWVRLLMVGAILIAPCFFHFAAVVVDREKRLLPLLIGSYLLAGVFIYFDFTSALFIKDLRTKLGIPFFPSAGAYYLAWLAQWGFWIIFSFIEMIQKWRKSIGEDRVFLEVLVVSTGITFFSGSFNYFLWFDIPIPPVTMLVVSTYALAMTYLLFRGKFYKLNLFYFEFFAGATVLISLLQFILGRELERRSVNAIFFGILLLSSYMLLKVGRRERAHQQKIDDLNKALGTSISNVINSIAAAVFIVNKKSEVVEYNAEALKLFGFRNGEQPESFIEFVKGELNLPLVRGLEQFMNDGKKSVVSTMVLPSMKQVDAFFSPFTSKAENDTIMVLIQIKNPPWGTVYDSKTLLPVPLAMVRMYDSQRLRTVASKVTDQWGRFDFTVGAGSYTISVVKEGYGGVPTVKKVGYLGEPIIVKEDNLIGTNVNILIDPIE